MSLFREGGFLYREAVVHVVLNVLLWLIGLGLRPGHSIPVPNALRVAAPVLGVLLLSAVLFVRAGEGARWLPIMYTPLAYLNLFGYEALHNTVGPREPVTLARNGPAGGHEIVLIIEESISGNYLAINSPFRGTSNLQQADPGIDTLNSAH